MNYRLIVGRHSESKKLSLSLDSNMLLIMNMLAAQERAIEEFEEEAIHQMDMEIVGDFLEQVDDIGELVENYTDENGDGQNDN